MAATQAEPQQNEVNRDIVQQEQQASILGNTGLQNGTDKSGRCLVGSEITGSKGKIPGQNNLSVEMSQYRQESGAGPPILNSDQNALSSDDVAGKINNSENKSYSHNSEQSAVGEQNYGKGPSDNGNQNMQGYGISFAHRGSYHSDHPPGGNPMLIGGENSLHHQSNSYNQFNPQNMRHGYPGSKPMPSPQRPPSTGPGMNSPTGFSPHTQQQRFMSGQSISQPTGPTPTLNQLLQSSNPVHRYQNSYGGDYMPKSGEQPQGNMPYNQNWPPPRTMTPYGPQGTPGYRNQPTAGGRGSQAYLSGGSGSPGPGYPPQPPQSPSQTSGAPAPSPQSSNSPGSQYPPYPQRYPTPPSVPPAASQGPPGRSSYPPHQLGSPYGSAPPQSTPPNGTGGNSSNSGTPWHPPSPSTGTGAPQPQQSPTPQPQPSPQPPPQSPQSQQSFPSRPQQSLTPNAHAPDPGDLSGQNSNDSSNGPAPGTPNCRPTPSPTGSTGSRSMSPAVGQQNIPMPPRPSSSQSDGGGPAPGPTTNRMSHSPMSTQGGYQQQQPQLGPPAHMHNYKMGPGMVPQGPHPPYPSQQQYPQQGNYSPRPQAQLSNIQYGPNQSYGGQNPQANNMPGTPGSQYPSRPMPNHVPHTQLVYQGGWGGPMNQGPPGPIMPGGKGGQGPPPAVGNATQPPPQTSNTSPGPRSHTPPHQAYLKQHLQHKVGFASGGSGMPPSPGSYPNNSTPPGMGPPHHHPMGPPHHAGMGPPPTMGPPNNHSGHHEGIGPMPPPSSTPNSHQTITNSEVSSSGNPPGEYNDNGITTTATGTVMTSVSGSSSSSQGGVTSLVTTGPDGAPIDEASQQSTLSNASAASGEDPTCTPSKSRKDVSGGMYPHSHPATPQSTAPSPGAASLNSMHEEYPPDNSPTWPRTPASPVYNSHVPQDIYRPKKHDSLGKLYEMDDNHERRLWLDKLLQFMEERGTPISACPTISKNPLDLFRLYLFVKERGGFMEVTKNKIWKDIAGLLGIGASSSAAYTLRKHYTKNLLPYECHFDRGGIDPQPIINQVEASSKKKGSKTAPVPSPGSSNSQDSFPSGGGSSSMDGYGYGYPPDYNNQRPPSQSNQGMQGGYQGQGGYSQYPDQYNQQYPTPGGNYPSNRPMYPYGPDSERGYNQNSGSGQSPGTQGQPGSSPGPDPYNRYMGPGQPPGYPPRPGYGGPTPSAGSSSQPTPPGQPPSQTYPPPAGGPPQQEYYRQDQVYQGQSVPGAPGGTGAYPGGQPNKNMPPPTAQPRRHPDFASKDQQPYPPYNQQRPMYGGGWSNGNNNQYRGQFSSQSPGPGPGPQQWNQVPARPGGPPAPGQPPQGQWDQQRYPPGPNQPPYQSPQWGVPNMGNSGMVPNAGLRPGMGPRPGYRPDGKPYGQMSPAMGMKPGPPGMQGTGVKRELVFPMESVEAVTPVQYKRRKLGRADVAPLEAWRLMMALRSGLLAETTWALDVLNILLFDDASIAYFGLAHLPGLLDVLLEHFKKALSDMLETKVDNSKSRQWYEKSTKETKGVDLGNMTSMPDPNDHVTMIRGPDHTMKSRRGHPVTVVPASDELFVADMRRSWDNEEIDESADPPDTTKYIISCFHEEMNNVPFVRLLPDKKSEVKPKVMCENVEKKRTKSLNDVLERIKRDQSELVEVKVEEKKPEDDERVRDPAGTLRRRRMSDYEDECYSKDEPSLYLVSESQDALARRCICLSTILRNLTFVPGNEGEFAKNITFLGLLGKLLLLHHEHPLRTQKQRNYDREDDTDCGDCCSSLQGESEWWWEFLHHLRENALVCLANIAGHMDLGPFTEDVSRPLLDGLLHWAVCPAAQGQDAFPTVSSSCPLSPQRLALEALCKLCVTDANVDLVIATPPYSRLDRLCAVLTRFLCRSEEQVLREFSINLLHYLAAADSGMARTIALQSPCVSLLVAFIEQAETSALNVANQHGITALRDNPDCMGTSLDMLRRAARTLLSLSKHPDNRALFLQQEQRLLALVMSQILDQQVAALIARVLYHCSRAPSPEQS